MAADLHLETGDARGRTQSAAALWGAAAFVAAVTVVVFSRTLGNPFVQWDDYANLIDNRAYRGLTRQSLAWMFGSFHAGHYHPLTWLTLSLDSAVWGTGERFAFGLHLTSVCLHAATAVAVLFLANALLGAARNADGERVIASPVVGAMFAALIFAVHPLRAESVAWATERRDVLCGLFYVLAVLLYVRGQSAGRRWRALIATTMLFVLALLSKVMAVTLPAVLLVLDVYPLRRMQFDARSIGVAIAEKLPMFALSAVFAALAVMAQGDATAMQTLADHGPIERLVQVAYSLAFYIHKTVIPLGLGPLYALPERVSLGELRFWSSIVFVVGVSAILIATAKRRPAPLAVWVVYAIILSPVSGIAQNGPQITADRYSYLSCIGWAILIGAALAGVVPLLALRARSAAILRALRASCAVGVFALSALTWNQIWIWGDSISLWTRALVIDEKCAFAWNNLGVCLAGDGDLDGAVSAHERALEFGGPSADTLGRLGVAYARVGRLEDAASAYAQALEINSLDVSVYINFANLRMRQGRFDDAYTLLNSASSIDHLNAAIFCGQARIMQHEGHLQDAERYYRLALEVSPDFADAAFHLGHLLLGQDRPSEAIQVWSDAIEHAPRDIGLLVNLSLLLSTGPFPALHDPPRAYALAERARAVQNPPAARALLALGEAAFALGDRSEAIRRLVSAQSAATAEGDAELARQITRKLAEYRSNGESGR